MVADSVLLMGLPCQRWTPGRAIPGVPVKQHGLLLAYLTTQDLFEDGGVPFPYLFFIHELGCKLNVSLIAAFVMLISQYD